MAQNTKIWVRRGYYALITAALLVVAVLLIVQCGAIYRLGGHPFTQENIAAHFAPIAMPVYICLGLAAAGFALSPLLPAAPDSAPDRDAVTLRRLQQKTDLNACPTELTRGVCQQRRRRNRHHYVTLVLLAIGTAIFLWYAVDITHYPREDVNGAVIRAMGWLAPCMGVPFLYGLFAAYRNRRSVKQEIALLRTAPKEAVTAAPKASNKREAWLPYVQGAILLVAIVAIAYGGLTGGAMKALQKAVAICKECIGLG